VTLAPLGLDPASRRPPAAPKVRVLVVDDSVVIRRLLTDALGKDERIEVVGAAANGKIALAKIEQLEPDVITLDIEMPELDGISTVKAIRATGRTTAVIMFSTLTDQGAAATLDALAHGADDYVTKPSNVGSVTASLEAVRNQLVPKVLALAGRRGQRARPAARSTSRPVPANAGAGREPQLPSGAARAAGKTPVAVRPRATSPVQLVVIGTSTGGPDALSKVLGALPATFPVPIAVVQHMPALFTRQLAERLDRNCALHVSEATEGTQLSAGGVIIAPGDRHLEVVKRGTALVCRLHDGPAENYCRPAVDVLFRSAAVAVGAGVHAVVLTGMGADGRDGARAIVAAGGDVTVQDEQSSVVWGMPGAVAAAGLASAVVPLSAVAAHTLERTSRPAGRRSLGTGGTR
jgi:two-component system chemotaxis response regulator CheB